MKRKEITILKVEIEIGQILSLVFFLLRFLAQMTPFGASGILNNFCLLITAFSLSESCD